MYNNILSANTTIVVNRDVSYISSGDRISDCIASFSISLFRKGSKVEYPLGEVVVSRTNGVWFTPSTQLFAWGTDHEEVFTALIEVFSKGSHEWEELVEPLETLLRYHVYPWEQPHHLRSGRKHP